MYSINESLSAVSLMATGVSEKVQGNPRHCADADGSGRHRIVALQNLVVLFVNKVTHQDDRGARRARREKQAYQVYASAEQHGAAGCIGH